MMMKRKDRSGGPCVGRFPLTLTLFLPLLFIAVLPAHAQEMVDPRSGRLFLSVTDLVVKAGAINLEIGRTIETERSGRGLLGTRWRLNWESRLVHYGEIVLVEEEAGTVSFTRDSARAEYRTITGERLVFEASGRAVRSQPDGTREAFDAQGRLVERDLRNGNVLRLRYSTDGQLSLIEGPRGSVLRMTVEKDGRLSRVESSADATVVYRYADGELSEVVDHQGRITRYAYSGQSLALILGPSGVPVEFDYDAKGRVTARRWVGGGLKERFEYDDGANRVRHVELAGAVTTLEWSADRRREELTDPRGHKERRGARRRRPAP